MASRYCWRQRLLGSLQGQLQLATYLVVFLGFTGASSVGLLIGQRNLLANDQQLARQSIALCDKAILGLQNDPARLEQELLFHSSANTNLWISDSWRCEPVGGSLRHHHNFNNSNQFSRNAHTRSFGVVSLNPLRVE